MKIKKSVFVALLAVVMAAGLVMGANADAVRQQIVAYMNPGITIKYDGEVVIPTDANGVRVYPVMYNGTTYVPVRAISGLLGLEVDWDQANQTVLLGNSGDGTDLIDTLKAYYFSNEYAISAAQYQTGDKDPQEISGINCAHWVELNMNRYAAKGALCAASFNVDGKYESVTFQYYSTQDITLRVLGDNGYELFKVDVPGGQVAQTVTVPLLNTTQLTFQAEKAFTSPTFTLNYDTSVYIFGAYVK